MKRAFAIAAALAFLALLASAFVIAGPRGNPGPFLSPVPINSAQLSLVEAQLELSEGGGPRQRVVFGRRLGFAPHEFAAAIVVMRESGPVEVPLDAGVFTGQEWVHAAASRGADRSISRTTPKTPGGRRAPRPASGIRTNTSA